jgi:hypothetical protein
VNRRAATLALVAGPALSGCGSDDYVIGRFRDDHCQAYEGALVCSGFERPDLSEWSDVIVVNQASVAQTDARAHEGEGALHAASRGDESAGVVAAEFPAVTSGEVYLRAYVFVPAEPITETMNLFFLGDYATPDPFAGTDFNIERDALSIYSPGNAPDRVTSATLFPRDRWVCFELAMTLSKDAGAVRVSLDGALGLEQTGMNTLPDGGVHLLRAGVDWSSLQTAPFDVYIDDLVVDTAPIGCGE